MRRQSSADRGPLPAAPAATGRAREPGPAAPPADGLGTGIFALFRLPGCARLWCSGWLWNMTRWGSVFLCSYLVNQKTGSPLLVQFVGAAFFAPMFFGGAVGGLISDRLDRRRTILSQLLVLMPVALLMALLVLSDTVHLWIVYLFMLIVGAGGMIDMTSRRALIYDFVGEARITNALALESVGMMGGNMAGSLAGGAIINSFGLGQAYLLIAACYAGSFLLMRGVRITQHRAEPSATNVVSDLLAGFAYVRRHQALISILGVTVIMNSFYFTFTPMVPVFAERLEVNALLTGVLASANGLGSMIGAFFLAGRANLRRGLIYVGGSGVAMALLFAFASAAWYPFALLALLVAGIGSSGFGTMQSVLVMTSAEPAMRGRALGLMSMAIGTLPFAMIGLGLIAQQTDAAVAVRISVVAGLLLLGLWHLLRPEAARLT